MDEKLKAANRLMLTQYLIYIAVAILLVVLYQSEVILEGTYAADFSMQYLLETIGILFTIALLPLSLKLFSIKLNKEIKEAGFEEALKLYKQWGTIRLMILAFLTYLNIIIYYMTLNNIGGLCALMALTASIFCLPGEKKIREELNLVKNNEENKEEI